MQGSTNIIQYQISAIYNRKKIVELVKYSTKKSKISHYPNNFLGVSQIEPYMQDH
jgi:hypothetical protein